MDIVREPPKRHKRYVYGAIVGGGLVLVTIVLGSLRQAPPTVDPNVIWVDTVERGTMVRQVRAPGSLEPEEIRWVAALTAGRVERKFVQPGTHVDASTVLLELSNPEVQLELLEAERQLGQAQAVLVTLRTTLEMQQLNQEVTVASVRAQHLEARRNAKAAEELAQRGLIAEAESSTAQERAEELATRLRLEERRLAVLAEAAAPQLDVQVTQVERLKRIVEFHHRRVASMRVTAGTDGVLQDMSPEEGQWILPGQTLARVVKPERLKAVLRVPQTQARDVALGQKVLVDARRDTILGHVTRIDPAVREGTVAVDVALEGELPPGARPDLSVDGTIEITRLDDVLYVGRPAYGQAQSTVALFRLTDGGDYAERVSVRLGRSSVNTIEIVEGLVEGDVVVLSDMSQWDAYERVRIR